MSGLIDAVRHGAVRFQRGTLPRKICVGALKAINPAHRLPQGLSEVRPLDRPGVSFEPVNSMVMDAIYWFGVQGYEGRMADVWESLCLEAENIVEIGANVGLFTVLGGRATRGRYVAVEPVPAVADVLRRNIARNHLSSVIDVRQAAAVPGHIEAAVDISIPNEGRDAPVGAQLVSGSEVTDRGTFQVVSVFGIPFRTLVERADLIKIDAEGAEAELLLSASDCIARNKPTIVLELLPESSRLAEVVAQLVSRHGYTINIIPAFGSDVIVTASPEGFCADMPRRHHSKDIVLAHRALA